MEEKVLVGGYYFPKTLYNKELKRFKEGLAHSSLSCEKAFDELDECREELDSLIILDSLDTYYKQSIDNKEKIRKYLHFFIVYCASYGGIISERITSSDIDNPIVEEIYKNDFSHYDELLFDIIVFDNGIFDEKETYRNVIKYFRLYAQYEMALNKAYYMKSDHLSAFDFALKQEKIGVKEILKINEIINSHDENAEVGFKKVNNIIQGAGFDTHNKIDIPREIQELVYKYDTGFGDFIPTLDDPKLSIAEKNEIKRKICAREAKLHIEFERIHPFADGNGRTGRVILNANLIRNGMAPVLVVRESMEKYKKFISDYDIEGFTEWLLENSSQTLTPWVTDLREKFHLNPSIVEDPNLYVEPSHFIKKH